MVVSPIAMLKVRISHLWKHSHQRFVLSHNSKISFDVSLRLKTHSQAEKWSAIAAVQR